VKDERLHNALMGSSKLSGSGQHEEALRLMDEVIAEAIKERDELTALVVIDHAALLNGVKPDRSLAKHYYERFLAYSPESPRVLYELADIAMEDGQIDVAKEYAKRCHQAILQSGSDKIKQDLLDLVLERWPEVAAKS
jgi:hypothetical protein